MPANDSTSAPSDTPRQRHPGLLVIAYYEIAKTVCLVLLALAAFHLDRQDNFKHLLHWLEHLDLTGSNGLRWKLVSMLVDFGPSKFVAVGLVTLGYAVLFAVEGVGLWMGKYWAEWFTVIATASLIPIELFEAVQRVGWIKLMVLGGNVVIVVYLVRVAMQSRRLRAEARRQRAAL